MNDIFNTLLKAVNKMPAVDVHTHLNSAHLSARGLHDIMLYHMIISELYSAGCPIGTRLSDEPDDNEKIYRIEQAIPYLKHIQNTSCYWLIRSILSDLYGWDEPITLKNWRKLDEQIQRKSSDQMWARQVFDKANISRASTELALRDDGCNDDILFYCLEWAFFARNQWAVFDAPLYELEYARQFDEPQTPLPVSISNRQPVKNPIRTVSHVKEAMAYYCGCIPYDIIVSTAQHISTDINYREVTDEQMQKALDNRNQAGQAELDIYASYLFETFLYELERNGTDILFQFSLGAEPLPFETDSRINQSTIKQFSQIVAKHPKIKFQCFLSSKHANQAMCTLARELPNLTLAGYWWHNFFPCHIAQVIDERLDMLPMNKQVGFFSDAYCVDWLYAKSKLVRAELAKALVKRIERGQFTEAFAIEVAGKLLNRGKC